MPWIITSVDLLMLLCLISFKNVVDESGHWIVVRKVESADMKQDSQAGMGFESIQLRRQNFEIHLRKYGGRRN